jgi:hypothetical protein
MKREDVVANGLFVAFGIFIVLSLWALDAYKTARRLNAIVDRSDAIAYQKLVTLGQSVWRLARASMLIDINWVEPSLVEFQSGRPIVWETRAVVVHKDFPTFAPTATTNTVTEVYTYQDDIVGS